MTISVRMQTELKIILPANNGVLSASIGEQTIVADTPNGAPIAHNIVKATIVNFSIFFLLFLAVVLKIG